MNKTFCDYCEAEMTGENDWLVLQTNFKGRGIEIRVLTPTGGGEIACEECLASATKQALAKRENG